VGRAMPARVERLLLAGCFQMSGSWGMPDKAFLDKSHSGIGRCAGFGLQRSSTSINMVNVW